MAAVAPPETEARRFAFGRNWAKFLRSLDAGAIERARQSLCELLEVDNLTGRRFLDVGCGSGLFSLVARELGATVVSFDFDTQCVACAEQLKRSRRPGDSEWTILGGSILDRSFVESLGRFDVVYAWGVLHHTGQLQTALAHTGLLVGDGGLLCVAIYNDQGGRSRRWRFVKRLYNRLPRALRFLVVGPALVGLWGPPMLRDLVRGRPFDIWRNDAARSRGMNPWRDAIDWIGGYPFEVARPEEIFDFYRRRGFVLRRLITCGGGHGCNQFVFQAGPPAAADGGSTGL